MTDLVAVGILPSFAVKGFHLLLGNDLDKVVVNPLLTNVPCIKQPLDPIERETPIFYPSFAITITMSKKAKQNDGDIDSFLGQSFKHNLSSLSDKQTDLSDKSESSQYSSILNDQVQGHNLVSRTQHYKKQRNDPKYLPLLERAFDEKEIDQVPICFYVKNGILMRKWVLLMSQKKTSGMCTTK